MKTWCLICISLAILSAAEARAEFYKWTDAQGEIHVTDSYDKVPPRYRPKVKIRKFRPRPADAPPPSDPEDSRGISDDTWNGSGSAAAPSQGEVNEWSDWNGHGGEYWSGKQRDLQAKTHVLEQRLEINRQAVETLRSSRAVAVGSRAQRGQIEQDNKQVRAELQQTKDLLKSGLADEATQYGVPMDEADGFRGSN
ncbi:MAG: DUF4124 domain-containing protein [Pseudomonadota bacterium]